MPWKATHQTKPPPVAQSATSSQNKLPHVAQTATSAQNKHDDDLSTTSSSSIHSGMQAFELLVEDDDLYFNMKQPATFQRTKHNQLHNTYLIVKWLVTLLKM